MSLINDALKKAQKQRTGEAPALSSMPSIGGEAPRHISRRGKPAGPNFLLIGGGAAAAVLVLGAAGWFAFGGKAKSESPTTHPTAAASQTSVPAPASVSSPQPAAPAAPAFTLPIAPKPEPVVAKVEPAKPLIQTPAQPPQGSSSAIGSATAGGPKSQVSVPSPAAPAPQPAEPAKPALKLEPRAIQYIEGIKVAGIRASATDPKVLMNDRVYRPGSVVEAELGLRLVEIATNALTFEDDRGGRYTRTF